MSVNLSGRVAVVTGGARGIGLEISITLAKHGAHVAIIDKSAEDLEKALEEVEKQGVKALGLTSDATKRDQIDRAISEVVKEFNQIDILVNNVGAYPRKPFIEMTEEFWREMIDVNLTSAFLFTKAVVPIMMKRMYGRIINISSITGLYHGVPGLVYYGAAKAGLVGFTKCLAGRVSAILKYRDAIAPGSNY
jgi:Dehydrogenases with different specificities (related to short-chain alcohol dehydrogenases)